jgi:hypothetical protein
VTLAFLFANNRLLLQISMGCFLGLHRISFQVFILFFFIFTLFLFYFIFEKTMELSMTDNTVACGQT